MAIKIVVDGYNLLYSSPKWHRPGNKDLTMARAELMHSLNQYKKDKKHSVLVVFDGGKGGWPTEQRDRVNGIDIIYSRSGELADDVIIRLAEKLRESAIVVTSDRELADIVTGYGATVISSGRFEDKLKLSAQADDCGDEDDEYDKPITTKKKGTAYRRSKRDRQRQARLKKL